MKIAGHGNETYLYVNGISTSKNIVLHDGVVLVPVTSEFNYKRVSSLLENDIDFAVAAVSGRTIKSQIRITASDEKQLAFTAWNALWDYVLLGAIFHCDVMVNIQCDKPVEELNNASFLNITNYKFYNLLSEPYYLSQDDENWISKYYLSAYKLLDKESFMVAVHAMASYKWHSMPRVELAVIWAGIESLFDAQTEISFRISLYIANFLAGDDIVEAKDLFAKIRKLYTSRSAAVHGGKIKGDLSNLVFESAQLLNRIIRRCAELGDLPNLKGLVFPSSLDNTLNE